MSRYLLMGGEVSGSKILDLYAPLKRLGVRSLRSLAPELKLAHIEERKAVLELTRRTSLEELQTLADLGVQASVVLDEPALRARFVYHKGRVRALRFSEEMGWHGVGGAPTEVVKALFDGIPQVRLLPWRSTEPRHPMDAPEIAGAADLVIGGPVESGHA